MIILDTTVLVYSVGAGHALRDPCRKIIEAIGRGRSTATTSAEVIQEFVHVRAKRRPRPDAAQLGAAFVDLLSPLLELNAADVRSGLRLFGAYKELGAFDAVLAASAIARDAEALVSADSGFSVVRELRHLHPTSPELDQLL